MASNIPVDVYLWKAENKYHWAIEDENEQKAIYFDWNLVMDILERIDQRKNNNLIICSMRIPAHTGQVTFLPRNSMPSIF